MKNSAKGPQPVCKEQQAPLIQTMKKAVKAPFEYKQVSANTSGGKGGKK